MKPMYNKVKPKKAVIKGARPYEGESLELTIARMISNKERIIGQAPAIYTERSEGVPPAYNVRTDKMEIALEAQTKKSKGIIAQREAKMQALKGGKETEGQSIQATGGENITPSK